MCPVAAESKNSNPTSKKKINKKFDSNLEKGREEEIMKNQDPIQNALQNSIDNKGVNYVSSRSRIKEFQA